MRILLSLIFCLFFISNSYCLPTYTEICSKLLDQSNWQGRKCEGMNMQGSPMGEMVTASRTYIKGDKKIEVMVLTGMAAASYNAQIQQSFQVDTSDEFVKVMDINGYKVAVSYDKMQHSGGIVVPFKSKDNPSNVVAVMVFSFENMSWEEALRFAKGFSWDGIGKLFK